MPNRYLLDDARRADGVRNLFASIARRYDLVNDLQSLGLHRRWKRRLVRLAQIQPGHRALDLCCGTGDITFALARAGADVVGVDFSQPMLDVAARRAAASDRQTHPTPPAPRFEQGDALALRFPPDSFDVITIGYGLRNLRSVEEGLREMRRVLAPGGRLLILDFALPDSAPLAALFRFYLRAIVPVMGALFGGDRAGYAYILESLERYPRPDRIADLMRESGFSTAEWWPLLGGMMTVHRGVLPPSPGAETPHRSSATPAMAPATPSSSAPPPRPSGSH